MSLVDARREPAAVLVTRCTYGVVWTGSVSVQPTGRAVALAVQPMAGWRELWVFRRRADGWSVDALPPGAADPSLGYVEFAGWVPGEAKVLLAREVRVGGRCRRSFEVANLATLNTEKQAGRITQLAQFAKWHDPAWRRSTVSLR